MKTLKILMVVLISASIIGCKNQVKNSSDKQNIIPKSSELVFGDKKVTYVIEGEGIPCFVCDYGYWEKNGFSDSLRNHFQFVFIDQRTCNVYDEPRDYSKITLDTIVNDLESVRKKLGFEKIYVLGHSMIGMLALEYARKYPERTLGVIMIGTPPSLYGGGENYMNIVQTNWEEKASDERKRIFEKNHQNLNEINKDSIPKGEWDYLKIAARVPMDWYDPKYDIVDVFPHIPMNDEGESYLFSLLVKNDITRSPIEPPIFLSLSKHDYIVPENMWNDYEDKLEKLNIYRFEKSGHYPHVEEQELFDKNLLEWVDKN